ncbi:MAG TPA: ferredoxin [Candidatus Woesearchaeota archaeon]|nr:ferredoxin [Candidatus Woesearchaeota archaeon]
MAKYKIIFHEEKCIGCGACSSVCPGNWELSGEKVKPLNTDLDELKCNSEAKEICPVGAIEITEQA